MADCFQKTAEKVEKDMSLIKDFSEKFVLVEKKITPDGLGGYSAEWADGEKFTASITFDNSTQAQIAAAQGVTSLYKITTKKDVVLYFHDVVRRVSDGKIFRVTSDSDDKFTPKSAHLNMRQVSAEEWALPQISMLGDDESE